MAKILVVLALLFMVVVPLVGAYKLYSLYRGLRERMGFGARSEGGERQSGGGARADGGGSARGEGRRGKSGDRPIVSSEDGARRMDTMKEMAEDAEVVG